MKVKFLNLDRQWDIVGDKIQDNINAILKTQKYIKGDFVDKFEEQWATANDAKYAITTSNGTTALEVALRAHGLNHKHTILTVPNTFIATVEAIYNVGAKPMFVDVEKDTVLMDMDKVESLLKRESIDAIIPVHLFGQPCDMKRLVELQEKYDFRIIQDGCQAHLAEHNHKQLVKYGTLCHSFYPGKNLGGISDGGAIVTDNEFIYDTCKMITDHGRRKGDKYEHEMFGTNTRMSEINASALCVKLPFLRSWNKERRSLARRYDYYLDDHIIEKLNNKSSYHLYVLKKSFRSTIKTYLEQQNISCGIHYPDLIPGVNGKRFPIAEQLRKEILSIPICPYMKKEEQTYIIKCLNEVKQNDIISNLSG